MAAFGWFALGAFATTAVLFAVAHCQQRTAVREQEGVYGWLRGEGEGA